MVASSRLTVAIHALAMMALEKRPLSSSYIASSVNTNPVVIRRILGQLQLAGFIETKMGANGGAYLVQDPSEISLLDVAQVTDQGERFNMPNNKPSIYCPCGRQMQPIMQNVFSQINQAIDQILTQQTIADVASEIAKQENLHI